MQHLSQHLSQHLLQHLSQHLSQPQSQHLSQHLSRRLLLLSFVLLRFNNVVAWAGRDPLFAWWDLDALARMSGTLNVNLVYLRLNLSQPQSQPLSQPQSQPLS